MRHTYIVELPRKVDQYTHFAVREEIRTPTGVRLTGLYGRMLASGFVANSLGVDKTVTIDGELYEDLQEQVTAAGRPRGAEPYEYRSADVAAWVAAMPDAEARVAAKRAARAEAAAGAEGAEA